jgi:hypothetical protein
LRRNFLLKYVIGGKIKGKNKWREEEEEDVGRYWMALNIGEDTGNWKRKY